MNFVTFFIQQQSITAFVVEIESQINKVLFEQTVLIEQENIAYSLQQLNKKISHFINSKDPKIVYRIILANDLVMQRDVQLPKVQLSDYELEQYIKNLLPKIFHTSNRLVHDYVVINNNNIDHQISQQSAHLIVFAYEQRLIDEYGHSLHNSKIDFIGVVDEFNPLCDKSILSNIAALPIINGINFLPWRERLKQHKKNRFFVEVISGLLILSCIVIFQYNYTLNQLQNVISLNSQLQTEQANKSQQLLTIIQLDKQVKQIQIKINEKQNIQKQFTTILDYLIFLSSIVPDGLWINSLEYKDNSINLIGNSFLYADILAFSKQQNEHPIILNNQITVIKKQGYLLQFNNHIQLAKSIY